MQNLQQFQINRTDSITLLREGGGVGRLWDRRREVMHGIYTKMNIKFCVLCIFCAFILLTHELKCDIFILHILVIVLHEFVFLKVYIKLWICASKLHGSLCRCGPNQGGSR